MPDRLPPISLDLSGLRDVSPPEIAPLVEKVARDPEERALSNLTALLMNRVLRLLRQGSRQEILDEALMLNRVLAIEAGSLLRQSRPEAFGRWTALGELLSGAARATGHAAVPSILSGTRGREVLELLAGEGRPLARSDIKRRLGFTSESHLSHLLRDLEEARLVLRYKPERGKEVVVELGDVGRQVVDQSILPLWIKVLKRLSTEAESAAASDLESVIWQLQEAGAPSRSAAEHMAALVLRWPVSTAVVADESSPEGDPQLGKILQFMLTVASNPKDQNHLKDMLNLQGNQKPAAMFGVESEEETSTPPNHQAHPVAG